MTTPMHGSPVSPKATGARTGWLLLLAGSLASAGGQAQIRTDGSLGMPAQTLSGPNYAVTQALGRVAGNNLFHSFQTFSLAAGETASFSTSSPGIANVISRVTGGEISQINGTVRLTAAGGTPALFFMNPAGVTFGAGASVDVPGAFHVSTANYLRFPDGNFHADANRASTFSTAEPAAFGFLGTSRATINVRDSVLSNTAGGITLVAGDVLIDHAGVWTGSGDIRLVANGAGAAEIAKSGALPPVAGHLEIGNGSSIYSTAGGQPAGGNIGIAAGDTGIRSGALVVTASSGATPAGAITTELSSLEIDGRSAAGSTGITSWSALGDTGSGGNVTVAARGGIRILGGGMIASDTYGAGPAGNVSVRAGSLLLDGAGHPNAARITSRANSGATGDAGALAVDVADSIVLRNTGRISSDSFGSGQAGSIGLRTGKDISVLSDSFVTSDAYAAGNAGTIDIAAQELTVDASGGALLTQISSQALFGSSGHAGSIRVATSGALNLVNGGRIITDTYSTGNAGDIQVAAGTLLLDGRDHDGSTGIFSTADFFSTGNAGKLNIDVSGDAQILQSAKISSNTWSRGNGGSVVFRANNLLIDGMGNLAGAAINSEATAPSSGNGGSVSVAISGQLQIVDGGYISATTLGQGNAGAVSVTADKLTIDGKAFGLAGIESSSFTGSTGSAGKVSVKIAGDTRVTRNGYVRSDARAANQAGDIALSVGGDLQIDEGGRITSATGGSGHGGNLEIRVAGGLNIGADGQIRSDTMGSGDAGNIDIGTGQAVLARGDRAGFAWILSDSRGSGAAGSVKISADRRIELAEGGFITSDAYDSGHAGTVSVSAPEIRIGGGTLLVGAAISSDTYSSGNAGRVEANAQTLSIEGGRSYYPTGITSRSLPETSGNAGTVIVNVGGALQVLGGGIITSSTAGTGRGGQVQGTAASIQVSGTDSQIGAAATATSSGQPGNVTIRSDTSLWIGDGGSLSIENDGNNAQLSTLQPSVLSVQARNLTLVDGSIKASSTGNVAAGTLQIDVGDRLSLNRSGITTSANAGNGGSIDIRAGKVIDLKHSRITTSVTGASGNGGNIQIGTDALVLDTGFIQANTTANLASGGLVGIGVKILLASGNTLFVGGSSPYDFAPEVFGFNVIQAAAPTGVSGTIRISSPVLDLSGSLGRLGAQVLDGTGLGRNPCQVTAGSSLAQTGRGGMPASSRGLLRAEPEIPVSAHSSAPPSFAPASYARLAHACR